MFDKFKNTGQGFALPVQRGGDGVARKVLTHQRADWTSYQLLCVPVISDTEIQRGEYGGDAIV